MTSPNTFPPFPQRDDREIGYKIARTTAGSVPYVGGALKELIDSIIGSPLNKRRDEWFVLVGTTIQKLAERGDKLDVEQLGDDPEFVSIVYDATDRAMRTHHQEKIQALNNVVANAAIGVRVDDALRGRFLACVERFSPSHLRMLRILQNPSDFPLAKRAAEGTSLGGSLHAILKAAMPEFGPNDELMEQVHSDLAREEFVDGSLNPMMTGSGLLAKRTTAVGNAFLRFIAEPEGLS